MNIIVWKIQQKKSFSAQLWHWKFGLLWFFEIMKNVTEVYKEIKNANSRCHGMRREPVTINATSAPLWGMHYKIQYVPLNQWLA